MLLKFKGYFMLNHLIDGLRWIHSTQENIYTKCESLTHDTEKMRLLSICTLGTLEFFKNVKIYYPALNLPMTLVNRVSSALRATNEVLIVTNKTALTGKKFWGGVVAGTNTRLNSATRFFQVGRYHLEAFLIVEKWSGRSLSFGYTQNVKVVKDLCALVASGCGAFSVFREIQQPGFSTQNRTHKLNKYVKLTFDICKGLLTGIKIAEATLLKRHLEGFSKQVGVIKFALGGLIVATGWIKVANHG
jgi:hypothetical protein